MFNEKTRMPEQKHSKSTSISTLSEGLVFMQEQRGYQEWMPPDVTTLKNCTFGQTILDVWYNVRIV